jgi:hypothetical protein
MICSAFWSPSFSMSSTLAFADHCDGPVGDYTYTSSRQFGNPNPKSNDYNIVLEPETRPISQEQLVAEVKGIYAGLIMGEAKCIEVIKKQATLAQADELQSPPEENDCDIMLQPETRPSSQEQFVCR